MLVRAPVTRGAPVDREGRPALGADCRAVDVVWVKPLADPLGGTSAARGGHPARMIEPTAPDAAPEYVVQRILGPLQFSDACLRVSGHPQLLAIAETINGANTTPFHEAVWIKQARLGGSFASAATPRTGSGSCPGEGPNRVVFDAARIHERSRLIMYAIDARAEIKDYNLLDLFI
jgi:hypothetical protein